MTPDDLAAIGMENQRLLTAALWTVRLAVVLLGVVLVAKVVIYVKVAGLLATSVELNGKAVALFQTIRGSADLSNRQAAETTTALCEIKQAVAENAVTITPVDGGDVAVPRGANILPVVSVPTGDSGTRLWDGKTERRA